MKKRYLILFFLLCSSLLLAQEKNVSGKITDQNGEPLPGANITIEGTIRGAQADFDGNFNISVQRDEIIIISYIGFKPQRISFEGQETLNVILEEDSSQLNEVVVIGYGTSSKKDLTGSISTVSAEAISERSTTNISNALQGASSGVVVTRTSSEPGSGSAIRIRGNTTLEGSNSPLILVDDVPVDNIDNVPPEQVESISILKDGAAAAIYGSRAAAGVIIVTTKRAKQGLTRVSYTGEYIVNTPARNREYVDAVTFMQLANESQWNDLGNPPNGRFPIWSEDFINKYVSGEAASNPDLYPNTDWADLMLRKQATGYRHNINISGGSEKIKTNVFVGYEEQGAFYISRNWRRYTARINNDIKISDKIGAIADISFNLTKDERPTHSPYVLEQALTSAQVYPGLWQDGRISGGRDGGSPYAILVGGGNSREDSYQILGKLGVFYKPINGMKISLNLSPNFSFSKYHQFRKRAVYYDLEDTGMNNPRFANDNINRVELTERRNNLNSVTTQALVDYKKSFDRHNIDGLVGYEEYSTQNETLGVIGRDFVSSDIPYLNQAPTGSIVNNGTDVTEIAYASLFGRVNYNFDNRYAISGVLRRDGSSRFGSDYRWGNFPSVSAAWTVSNENFMKSLNIPFLKLKASYGSLGNDRIGNYLYLAKLDISNLLIANGSNIDEVRGLAQTVLATPDISWETTISKNFGLELGLFDNKLSLEGEYYIKDTEDMLIGLTLPLFMGFGEPIVNLGAMQTKGWDFNASWYDTVGSDFNYSLSFNLSDAESIIGDINERRIFSGNTLSEEGHEFRSYYGLKSDGLFQTQADLDASPKLNSNVQVGDVKYKDIGGPDGTPDGVINDFDRTFLGSSLPRYTYGGRINMDYKGFDLGIAFQGVAKSNFYLHPNLIHTSNVVLTTQEYADSYWSLNNTPEENLNVKYPRMTNNQRGSNYRFSDFWLKDGGYLKIKTLSLGYTIPNNALEKVGITKLRVYASGNDLFSFHNLPDGIDPEQTSGFSYYITKSFILGINVNF